MSGNILNFVRANSTGLQTPAKDNVRTFTDNFIRDFALAHQMSEIKMLTLPSAWWRFETNIKRRLKAVGISVDIKGIEKSWKIFCMAAMNIPRSYKMGDMISQDLSEKHNCQVVHNGNRCSIMHLDVFDYMEKTSNYFQCIWLDTNSPATAFDQRLNLVSRVIDTHGPAVFAITFLKGRENRVIPKNRVEYISSIIRKADPRMRLKVHFEYMDSSPMIHLIYSTDEVTSGIITDIPQYK